MKRFRWFLASALCLTWLSGCTSEPEIVRLDGISFPVVLVLRPTISKAFASRASVISSADDLGYMRLSLYSAHTDLTQSDPPILIDSHANIFLLKDIKGQRGSLWMMLNPTGAMPIVFTLQREQTYGLVAARAAILKSEFLGRDVDPDRTDVRRRAIQIAQSMEEIIRIIEGHS